MICERAIGGEHSKEECLCLRIIGAARIDRELTSRLVEETIETDWSNKKCASRCIKRYCIIHNLTHRFLSLKKANTQALIWWLKDEAVRIKGIHTIEASEIMQQQAILHLRRSDTR